MPSKPFTHIVLILALAKIMGPCFSAEDPNVIEAVAPNAHSREMAPIDLMLTASAIYEKTCSLPDTQNKADQFNTVIEMASTALSKMEPSVGEAYIVCTQLKGLSLKQQGTLLHNLAVRNFTKSPDRSVNRLRTARDVLRLSLDTYGDIKDAPNISLVCETLSEVLETFAMICAVQAEPENDLIKAISLYKESIGSKTEGDRIFPRRIAQVDPFHIYTLALHKMIRLFSATAAEFDRLCQPQEQTMHLSGSLLRNAESIKNLIDFIDTYILKTGIDFSLTYESRAVKHPTRSSAPHISPFFELLRQMPQEVDSHTFIQLPWSIYCGSLRQVSLTLLEVPCPPSLKVKFEEKSQEHLQSTIEAYKKNLYQREYEGNLEKENAYILACLDDLVGKPERLKAFYKTIRQERKEIRRQIQEQKLKETIREQEEAQRKRDEEQRKHDEDRSKKRAESPHLVPTQPLPSTSLSSPHVPSPVTPLPLTGATAEPKSAKKDVHKEKPRTKPWEEKASAAVHGKVQLFEDEARALYPLDPNNHFVFHSLTGGIFNRHISLDQVIQLLAELHCKITTGRGSHNKATAENGKMWTIPRPWDGPIPHRYRQQLNDFLQLDLNLDPDDIIVISRSGNR